MSNTSKNIVTSLWIIFFAALIMIGAFISFPLGPVPFTLQILYVFLAGLCIGPHNAVFCILLYICAGIVGIPVFAGGTSGFKVLLNLTNGYIFGFIGMAYLSGLGESYRKTRPPKKIITLFWMTLGLIFLYICGATGIMWNLNITPSKALLIGVVPFILGDIIKLFLAFVIWNYLLNKNLLPK